MSDETFHDPHHNHDACCSRAIAQAESICAEKSVRLTPIRRRVLEIVLASHRPVGAYDIIARYAVAGAAPPAPITVYRALDFLMEAGLVHRIESRNAYLACNHSHKAGDDVIFLICDQCGEAGEVHAGPILGAIAEAAGKSGFTPRQPVIEIGGTCARCNTQKA